MIHRYIVNIITVDEVNILAFRWSMPVRLSITILLVTSKLITSPLFIEDYNRITVFEFWLSMLMVSMSVFGFMP